MKAKRVIIADNQALTALATETIIRALPDYSGGAPEIEFASNCQQLRALLRDKSQTVVVLDYTLFDFSDCEQLVILSESNSNVTFLLLSDELTPDFLRYVIYNSQRIGVVYKDASLDILREAMSYAVRGERYIFQQALQIILVRDVAQDMHKDDLTQTEREVLKSIAQGKTTKEIAAERFSSIHTINSHRKNIFRKLNVNCAHDAMKYALRAGLVDETDFFI
ncbi:MAG: response regulator transcription factor [Paludibacteraceae bacterium]|jgi:DNA-binding NarL/FixJ family response regulator|nr:response regulator transcription factor [Paludibacteraceae bacterium]MDD5997408.1 response regulator transcription factor [Bacteroidales bacterium]MDO4525396.1 response regulator transcription factor [Bacteroidales bacterium]MEE1178340.1 response regulator transcription factor [Paludibacteraceae bacterium]MEE1258774.1 response regulator transcription factor [Paludibacteraceae bacterium]